jgi:hypothetical protein
MKFRGFLGVTQSQKGRASVPMIPRTMNMRYAGETLNNTSALPLRALRNCAFRQDSAQGITLFDRRALLQVFKPGLGKHKLERVHSLNSFNSWLKNFVLFLPILSLNVAFLIRDRISQTGGFMDKSKSDDSKAARPDIQNIELEIEELEDKIAPKLAANHNETYCRD